jgi:hypothetical protein
VLTSPRTGVTSVMFNLVRRAASILTSSWAWNWQNKTSFQVAVRWKLYLFKLLIVLKL